MKRKREKSSGLIKSLIMKVSHSGASPGETSVALTTSLSSKVSSPGAILGETVA